jgi:hypothetical protein
MIQITSTHRPFEGLSCFRAPLVRAFAVDELTAAQHCQGDIATLSAAVLASRQVLTDLSTSPPNGTAAGNPPAIAAAQSASVVVRRWYPNGSCRRGDLNLTYTGVLRGELRVGT